MFFQVLGALKAVSNIFSTVKALIKFVEANKKEIWFQDMAKVSEKIRKAETNDDYQNAANDLSGLFGRM